MERNYLGLFCMSSRTTVRFVRKKQGVSFWYKTVQKPPLLEPNVLNRLRVCLFPPLIVTWLAERTSAREQMF